MSDDKKGDNTTLLVVGGLGILAFFLLGKGFGQGPGQGLDHGAPPAGTTTNPSDAIELFAAGVYIKNKSGLNLWGPLGTGFGWLADPAVMIAHKEVWLHPAKGVQEMVDAFKEELASKKVPYAEYED